MAGPTARGLQACFWHGRSLRCCVAVGQCN
uniref:Uncharacterized protein n=1 Tax=Arundo donax TaxID=35708 RepID=A0A0A8Z783_ARUDO